MVTQEEPLERRLAAIFAADVEGYSRHMETDEVSTLLALTGHRRLMDQLISQHHGRIANTAGDSVLAEFPSVIDAMQCAMAVQEEIARANEGVPENRRLNFRIGLHVGDVIVRGGDLFGEGVNVAARLEALAEPGGICISGHAHQYVRKLPLAYRDLGHQAVKNIEDPVRVYAVATLPAGAGSATTEQVGPKSPALPDKPSIAVLPFTNMSGDPEQEYFADGIVEEVIAALARVRSLFVIARNSTFTYKGKVIDIRQVSRELGVRYVLVGGVRKSERRLRVTAQLIDGTDGGHVWADRYDGKLEDIFDVQDELTSAIVGAIQPSIRSHEIERARRKRPENVDAYDCIMRALPAVWTMDQERVAEGLRLLEQAVSLDPGYALAKALASWCHAQQVVNLRSAAPSFDRQRAVDLAEQAARLDSDDPLVLTALSAAYTCIRRLDLAAPPVERALIIDPNSAWAWQRSGWVQAQLGHPEVAIEHFQRGLRLSPLDPLNFDTYFGIAAAHMHAMRYDQAVEWAKKSLGERPDAVWAYRILAAAYANAGRVEEAREAVAVLLREFPGLTISCLLDIVPFGSEYRSRFADGLRKAGLRE